MGRIGTVLEFGREAEVEWVKIDLGGENTKTADHYSPPGVDAPPLPGDFAALETSTGEGTVQATGYSDATTREASPGEHRTYARDSDGLVVGSLWLKGDGSIVAANAGGQMTLSTAGVLTVDCPEVRLGTAAGQPLARVGDLCSVVIPPMTAGPNPVTPVPPPYPPGSLNIAAAGQIISGAQTVLGGP